MLGLGQTTALPNPPCMLVSHATLPQTFRENLTAASIYLEPLWHGTELKRAPIVTREANNVRVSSKAQFCPQHVRHVAQRVAEAEDDDPTELTNGLFHRGVVAPCLDSVAVRATIGDLGEGYNTNLA
eukprot:scaffold229444_cov31-Tisochrysis_lutea.AAC.3